MASTDYSILTPERVNVQYDIAGLGSRCAAAALDTSVQAACLVVGGIAVAAGLAVLNANLGVSLNESTGTLGLAIITLILFLVANGYYILFEIVWNGQTPGKRVLGVRVIRESGYPLRPVDAVVRNLVRIVDWLPALYGVGVTAMLLNGRFRRLGDFAAGTIVVREGPRLLIAPIVASGSDLASATRIVLLSTDDASLVRDFLVRRQTLRTAPRAAIASRLASVLSQRYGLPLEADAEAFLERLAV